MANIIWTPPSGWIEETGAHVSFKAPCDCSAAGNLVIGSHSYSIVDALGKVITGTGGTFASGAVLDFILDCENSKAYLQNAASSMTLLWINASPGSSFAAQTISLSLSGYTSIMTVFLYSASMSYWRGTHIQSVDSCCFCYDAVQKSDISYRPRREVTASATGLVFGSGGYLDEYVRTYYINDEYAIPLYIYGIKGAQ